MSSTSDEFETKLIPLNGMGRSFWIVNRKLCRRALSSFYFIAVFNAVIPFSWADITVGTSTQASAGLNSQAPSADSSQPAIAANGRFIIFRSNADNLVPSDTNSSADIFIKDLKTGAVTLQSKASNGDQGNDDSSDPAISRVAPDGSYAIAFNSISTNLSAAPLDLNSIDPQIYVRLPSKKITELISEGIDGSQANNSCSHPSVALLPAVQKIRVAFQSTASNLITGDTNSQSDIFLATFNVPAKSGTEIHSSLKIKRISAPKGGGEADGASQSPVISADGERIVFVSSATNLTGGKFAAIPQVYLYQVSSGVITLISKDSAGNPGNAFSDAPSINYDGRFITYRTAASNILSDASTTKTDLVRYDTKNDVAVRVDVDKDGTIENGSVGEAVVAGSGRFVTFSSDATNIGGGGDREQLSENFVKDLSTGDLARVSLTTTGSNPNSTSNTPFLAMNGFTAIDGTVAYRSDATNLVLTPISGKGDVFSAGVVFSELPFSPTASIDIPPDVTVKHKNVTINMQGFLSEGESTVQLFADKLRALFSERATKTLQYEVRIKPTSNKGSDRRTLISKRNKVTVRKLRPGTYTVQYRVVQKQGTHTIAKSPFSPKLQFKV